MIKQGINLCRSAPLWQLVDNQVTARGSGIRII